MIEQINLSNELRKVFKNARKLAKEKNDTTITSDCIQACLIEAYMDNKIGDPNPTLSDWMKKSIKDPIGLIKLVKNVYMEFREDEETADELDDIFKDDLDSVLFENDITRAYNDSVEMTKKYPMRFGTVQSDIFAYVFFKDYAVPRICENTLEVLKEGIDNYEKTNGTAERVRSVLETLLGSKVELESNDKVQDMKSDEDMFEKFGDSSPISGKEEVTDSLTPTLDQFSSDMTKKAREKGYDPVIGRDDVAQSIIEILCKRKKANVAIVGVAGSGKSSVVEHLAQLIASGNVPKKLQGKRICNLNLNDLVAGTKYRGEYEERLQKIIKEVCNKDANVIVYIDELHNLVGSGSSSGSGDGANILKPYLARGEFQCIGSTTNEEYRKFIEKDAALNRRFTQVEITEPGRDETIKILGGIKSYYEKFHNVKIDKDVIEACVDWSSRYITDKNQPDKAIDLLDLSSSLCSLDYILPDTLSDDIDIEAIEKAKEEKRKALTVDFDFDEAEKYRQEELKAEQEVERKKKELKNKTNWPSVTVDQVASAVSKISKVPIDKINQTDREKISKMKTELCQLVIGQDKAISEVVKNLQRSWLGLRQPGKPIFTGLFVGNTGTGKTLICKEVARIFFGSEKNLIRIDCGELRDHSSVSKLTGTTAGYVGYDDEPLLLQVKRNPNSLLLLDEIDKCDPSIYEIFMNILDEGYCILGDGTRVDFTNSMIIFTGNTGTKELKRDGKTLGFVESDKKRKSDSIIMKAVEKSFKPEFINRLSSIVIFNELGKPEMKKIFNIEIDKLRKQLKKKKLSLKVTEKAKSHVIDLVDLTYGARDLKRLIDTWVIDPVSESMLDNSEATKFTVDYVDEKTVITCE